MKYNPPAGTLNPNASYITGKPGHFGGSAVPGEAIEHTQREIVSVIEAAGLEPSGANLTQLLEAIKLLARSYAGSPLLSIIWDLSSLDKPGYLDASRDNGDLLRDAYPEAAEELQRRYEAGDSAVVTHAQWVQEYQAYGTCPKYSIGDGVSTFRIPFLRGLYPGAPAQGQKAGDYLGDAIRNITGTFYLRSSGQGAADGVFQIGNYSGHGDDENGKSTYGIVSFDSSRVVPTAGVNRPKTAVMVPFIKMFG